MVDSAYRRAVFDSDQEGAAKEDFTALAALVTLALSSRQLLFDIGFSNM